MDRDPLYLSGRIRIMRALLSCAVVLLLASGVAFGQSDDDDQSLFESEATVDEPTDDQIDIPLGDSGDDSGALAVETENVTEETLCCQMSESEREGDDLCQNVTCP
jgi:hypothetical protein